MLGCEKCKKRIEQDEDFIYCDCCKAAYHTIKSCTVMSTTEIRAMMLQKQRSVIYFCDSCKSSFLKLPMLINKIVSLESEVSVLRNEVSSLTDAVNILKLQDNNRTPANTSTVGSLNHSDMLNEIQERSARANNVIAFDATESESQILQDKIQHDLDTAHNIVRASGLNTDCVIKVVRLGKKLPNKDRPLRIVLNNPQSSQAIVRSRRKLHGLGFNVNYDKTKMQQEIHSSAVKELKQRLNNGESNLRIVYRNCTPTIIKSTPLVQKN